MTETQKEQIKLVVNNTDVLKSNDNDDNDNDFPSGLITLY